MHELYQSFPIIIYYDETNESMVKWAKSFWLLKSPHPVKCVKLSAFITSLDPRLWLQALGLESTKALIVPATCRPCVDIDLLYDSHQTNRFSLTIDEKLIICHQDPTSHEFERVTIDNVIEDLGSKDGLQKINQEISFMRESLLMNV